MHMLINYHNCVSFLFGEVIFDVTIDHLGVFATIVAAAENIAVDDGMIEVERISESDQTLYRIPFFIQRTQRILIEPYTATNVICSYIADPAVEQVIGSINGSANIFYTLFSRKKNWSGRIRQVSSERIIHIGKTAVTVLPFYNDMTCKYEIMISADDTVHQYHKYQIQSLSRYKYKENPQEYLIEYSCENGKLETKFWHRPLTIELSIDEERLREFVEGVLKIPEGDI